MIKDNKLLQGNKKFQFYGRKSGRRLSLRKINLINNLLPKVGLLNLCTEKEKLDHFFSKDFKKYYLEIGFGDGSFLNKLANKCKSSGILGSEVYKNGIANLLGHIEKKKIDNVLLWPNDVRFLIPKLPKNKFSRIYILFPDPWPKKKHSERRIINGQMIDNLYNLLEKNGKLIMATDHDVARIWILSKILMTKNFLWIFNNKEYWYLKKSILDKTKFMKKAEKNKRKISWFIFKKI